MVGHRPTEPLRTVRALLGRGLACAALLLLLSASALAGDLAEKAALDAFTVVNEHCADVGASDVTLHANSVAKVAPAWAVVSAAYEAEGDSFLLYWRGVLAQCLEYQDKAVDDLKSFIEQFVGSAENATQVRDARSRLRRLGVKLRGPANVGAGRVGAIPGAVLATSAGALAALTLAQALQVQAIENNLETDVHVRNNALGANPESIESLQQRGESLALGTNITLVASISCAAASLLAFGVWRARLQSNARAGAAAPTMMFALAPHPQGGVALAWQARW